LATPVNAMRTDPTNRNWCHLECSRLAEACRLGYERKMRGRGPIYRLRSTLAALLGISSEQASDGVWWEIDLLLVALAGAIAMGIFAWIQI
jgi:hypothetical protein